MEQTRHTDAFPPTEADTRASEGTTDSRQLDRRLGMRQLVIYGMPLNITVFVFFFIKKKRRGNFFRYLVFPAIGLAIVAFAWSGFDRITFLFGGLWLVIGLVLGAFKYRKAVAFDTPR